MTNKKILIIGSNSFSGISFINYLLKSNTKLEIIGVSRSKYLQKEYNPINIESNKFKFFKIDLVKNIKKLFQLIEEFKPSIIINYAAQGDVRNSWLNPKDWFDTNTYINIELGNYLLNKPYLDKYVHISTPEVYGSFIKKNQENNNYDPSTPYAVSKLAGELFLNTLYKKYQFPLIRTRAANVYGPYQLLYRIIPRTILNIIEDKSITLHNRGKTMRSFIYIDDLSELTLRTVLYGKKGNIYHFSNQKTISLKFLISKIYDLMDVPISKKNIILSDENFGQDFSYNMSSKKSSTDLGKFKSTSLDLGIKLTINWVRNNYDNLKKLPREYIHKK